MISRHRAERLREVLDPFVTSFDSDGRVANDPVEAPKSYGDPADQEVAGLLASSLAYGRVELFKPKVMRLLREMGPSPATFIRGFDPERDGEKLAWFKYRFHGPADLGALFAGVGEVLRSHGSLGRLLASEVEKHGSLQQGLSAFSTTIRTVGRERSAPTMGEPAALEHLLSDPIKGGASKRLLLYLRWMVRRDSVDMGTWEGLIPKKLLIIPLDTHIMRVSRLLGFTRRKDASWRTAEEITASLRLLDPEDPVRYDFALCHLGMSGACPARRERDLCLVCPLQVECHAGRSFARGRQR